MNLNALLTALTCIWVVFSAVAFMTGFHNMDLANNYMNLGMTYDVIEMDLFGNLCTIPEVWMTGLRILFIGFISTVLSCLYLGYRLNGADKHG